MPLTTFLYCFEIGDFTSNFCPITSVTLVSWLLMAYLGVLVSSDHDREFRL